MAYTSHRRVRSPTPMPSFSQISLTPLPSPLTSIFQRSPHVQRLPPLPDNASTPQSLDLGPSHISSPQNTAYSPSSRDSSTSTAAAVLPSNTTFSSPTTPNNSSSSLHPILLRDMIMGFSDGLTVPFALTAGLSTLGSSHLVLLGGLAELFSGAISMGLGAYMASATDISHYDSAAAATKKEIVESPDAVAEKTSGLLVHYGIGGEKAEFIIRELRANTECWAQFLMDIQVKLERPPPNAPLIEAATTGLIYFLGGFLPMTPYLIFTHNVQKAFLWSIAICGKSLLAFGYIKARLSGESKRAACLGALHMLLVGTVAAGASYGIVYGLNRMHGA